MRRRLQSSDLRGAARMVTDATAGLADLVEAVHERIIRIPGARDPARPGRTNGISGLVYKTVRGVTRLVGGSIDALIGLLVPALALDPPSPLREAIVAALNGVLGDYLAATSNPLAITMAFRRDGRVLAPDAPGSDGSFRDAGSRVLVLVHGLCLNDLQWSREGHDHGAALARDLGFTPLYLNYNSGLHISINGRMLARQLELLLDGWPCTPDRLVLLGHSMGGLVARSALHYAVQAGYRWPARLRDLVFLGTPHHGAPLERAGHWIDVTLGAVPYAAPFARLGKVRSAGITDLRFGNLVDEDWVGRDRFARGPDRRQHMPLPETVRRYAAAASIGKRGSGLEARVLGDGLVPLDSALGRHPDASRTLVFADDRQAVFYGMNHLDLLSRAEVYIRLRQWLDERSGALDVAPAMPATAP